MEEKLIQVFESVLSLLPEHIRDNLDFGINGSVNFSAQEVISMARSKSKGVIVKIELQIGQYAIELTIATHHFTLLVPLKINSEMIVQHSNGTLEYRLIDEKALHRVLKTLKSTLEVKAV